ncbi:MAG: sugar phosphate isomerase/epimerase family protein [Pseudomonadota bacterium]
MLPLKIGASLRIDDITAHRDWLFDSARDLEVPDFIFHEVYKDGWQGTVDRAKAVLDGFTGRIGIHGPFIGLTIDNADPELRDVISRRYVQGVEAAAALGARQMVVHSPFDRWTHHHKLAGYGGDAQIVERVRAVMGPALALAETHGVTLVVENCKDVDPADRRRMVEAIGSSAMALSIDTGHAHLAHRIQGAPPVDGFVRDAGDRLRHVHIQDLDGHADRHWAPGEGSIHWREVFRALAACKSAPHLVLELRRHTDVPAGFAHLAELGLAA